MRILLHVIFITHCLNFIHLPNHIGKNLQCNALAYGTFALCMLYLCLWALFILVLHTCKFERECGDFSSLVSYYNNHDANQLKGAAKQA